MSTSKPDKIKQDSVPNVTIQVLEVKKNVGTRNQRPSRIPPPKKIRIIQHCGVLYCTQKGNLLSSITVPDDRTPLISKPANEHDPESFPFVNVQRHFFIYAP
jgi:hypothetical protein